MSNSLARCTALGYVTEETLFILRNATSLEAFLGLRYEFFTFNRGTGHRATLFGALEGGFLTVAGNSEDLVDNHDAGIGLLLTEGRFQGSYLELGYGTNEVFEKNSNDRWKGDFFLTWRPRLFESAGIYPYAQMTLDSDLDDGTDSVQTYIGFDFDADKLFGWK